MDPPHAQIHQLRLRGEDRDKRLGHDPGYHKHNGGKAQTQQQDIFFCLPDPVYGFGAVIVAEDCLGPAGDSQHGSGDQHHIALYDGSAGDQHIPFFSAAVFLQGGVEDNEDHAVSRQDQERRNAQRQDPSYDHRRKNLFPQKRNAYRNLFPDKEEKGKAAGGKLGDHSGNGSACHIHVKTKDKQRIQHNVGQGADEDCDHACCGKPLAGDEIVQPYCHQGEKGAGCVNSQVSVCVRKGCGACAEPQEQLPFGQQKEHSQCRRECHQQGKAVGKDGLCLFPSPCAHAHCHQDGTADADQRAEGGQQSDDRSAYAHPCQSGVSDPRNVSDEHAVNDAVEHGDELGDHGRDCQLQYQNVNPVFS